MAPVAVEWLVEASPKLQTPRRRPAAGGCADPGGAADRERRADRPGQMRGDRRRLRDHGERLAAEHLVAAARARVVRRRDQAQQDVPNGILPGYLAGRATKKAPDR